MLKQLVVVIISIGLASGASSVVNAVRADPRSSQAPIATASSGGAVVAHEQETTGSKQTEAATAYGEYVTAQRPMPNAFATPAALNSYVYGNGLGHPNSVPANNPIFGLSSNGDVKLSAYFGPAFWGFVAGLAAAIIVVLIVNIFGGFDYLGTAIRGIGADDTKKSAKARAIDVDRLAAVVWNALDKYNKWN